jgi:hypothetical protein
VNLTQAQVLKTEAELGTGSTSDDRPRKETEEEDQVIDRYASATSTTKPEVHNDRGAWSSACHSPATTILRIYHSPAHRTDGLLRLVGVLALSRDIADVHG